LLSPFQGQRIRQAKCQHEAGPLACYLLHADILLGLFFSLEDGGYILLQNVGLLPADCMAFICQEIEHFISTAVRTYIVEIILTSLSAYIMERYHVR
jgi:hypothetical protein